MYNSFLKDQPLTNHQLEFLYYLEVFREIKLFKMLFQVC